MTSDWKDKIREDMESEIDSGAEVGADTMAQLKPMIDQWASEIGFGELTARFLVEAEPIGTPSERFEQRLVETMRRAHEVRKCSEQARSLWDVSRSFGKALRDLVGIRCATEAPEFVANVRESDEPRDVGGRVLGDIARACGFLPVFYLVAYALERDFTTARDELVAEGLARRDRGLSPEEQRRQAMEAATAVLTSKRNEALALLGELARTGR